MKFNFTIKGFNSETDHLDERITKIDAWYDRHTRLWIIQKLNKDGDQIDEALYIAGKKNAMEEANKLKEELGI